MSKPTFDIDAAPQALRDGQDLSGKGGILTPLIKQFTEAAMQAEHRARSDPLGYENRGQVLLCAPRDDGMLRHG
jgi:hypothetical protein